MPKVIASPSELREQGRNAYPDGVNPYIWQEDRCAYVNWQEGFTQSKYAADWREKHMSKFAWNVGDWAVFERDIVQIKEIREGAGCSVSDGTVETSGMLLGRLRPLTLRNKRTIEWFAWMYRELRHLNGERGFNYPDISRHFSTLTLRAIDGPEDDKAPLEEAQDFVRRARDYESVIQGVPLFRAAA